MKFFKIILAFILFANKLHTIFAQYHDFGAMVGASYYIGDLNPHKHFAMPNLSFGGIYRYNFNYYWSLRGYAYYGKIESSDSKIKFDEQRNLSFKSNLLDIGSVVELNFNEFIIDSRFHRVSPFVFGGMSFYRYNPKAELNGVWYELKPLRTEGQMTSQNINQKPYKLYGFAIPFGVGMKFAVTKKSSIAIEWGMRKTFNDYLDDVSTKYPDVELLAREQSQAAADLSNRTINPETGKPYPKTNSQRGDSSTKDWYSFSGLTITIKAFPKKNICHDGHSK